MFVSSLPDKRGVWFLSRNIVTRNCVSSSSVSQLLPRSVRWRLLSFEGLSNQQKHSYQQCRCNLSVHGCSFRIQNLPHRLRKQTSKIAIQICFPLRRKWIVREGVSDQPFALEQEPTSAVTTSLPAGFRGCSRRLALCYKLVS